MTMRKTCRRPSEFHGTRKQNTSALFKINRYNLTFSGFSDGLLTLAMIWETITYYVCDRLFIYQVATTLTTFAAIRTALFIRVRRKRFQLLAYYGIPGPKPRLLDGNLHLYLNQKACYKVDEQLQQQYGKVYGFYIGDRPIISVSDLELLKAVFLDKMSSFGERAGFFIATPITNSILFATHNKWKLLRKVMSPFFSGISMRGASSTEFIEVSIQLMLKYIEDKFEADEARASNVINIDMHNLMQATALHLISSMAIKLPNVQVKEGDVNVESLNAFLSSVDRGIVIQAIRFPFLSHILTFLATHFEHNATMKRIHQGMNWQIDQSLRTQLEAGDGGQSNKQLIDQLIKFYREGRITRADVMSNAEALLIAGYDTTSTTLAYIFWVLGKHVEVQERLREELMAHGVESQYLEQVINETMRLYPTVITFTQRVATETVELSTKLTVPKGCQVTLNAWLVHRDPDYWPEPSKFDPERFRAGAQIHPCAFAPFGLGERKCIGYQLAKMELKMVTCDVLLRYRLKTRAPLELELISYADSLSKPSEKIMVEMERLQVSRK